MDIIDRKGINNSYRKSIYMKSLNSGIYCYNNNLKETKNNITINNSNVIKPNITVLNGYNNNNIIIKQNIVNNNMNDIFMFDDILDEQLQVNNILGDSNVFEMKNEQYYIIPELASREKLKYYGCNMYNINENINIEKTNLYLLKTSENYMDDYIYNKHYGNGIYLEYFDFDRVIITNNKTKGYLLLCSKKSSISYYISAFILPKNTCIIIPKNTIHSDCFLYGECITSYNITKNYSTSHLHYLKKLVKFNMISI
jgi:hypothetical protein